MRLLIVDDEGTASDRLLHQLKSAGFIPEPFPSAAEAAASPECHGARAVLISQGRAAHPAAEPVATLRGAGLEQPIVVIAARDDWRERVLAFQQGADAFLLRPVHSEEVAACLIAALRRHGQKVGHRMVFGEIEIDLRTRCAWRAGNCLDLTRNEFRMLQCLLLANGGFMNKQQIIGALWPGDRQIGSNAVEVLVARLRTKLGAERIVSARGMGYRLALSEMTADSLVEPGPCYKDRSSPAETVRGRSGAAPSRR